MHFIYILSYVIQGKIRLFQIHDMPQLLLVKKRKKKLTPRNLINNPEEKENINCKK